MNTVKDKPTKNGFSESIKDGIKPVKQKHLQSTAIKFISTFIVDAELYAKHCMNISSLQEWEEYKTTQEINPDGRYPCTFRGCQSSFRYVGRSRRQHELTHDPPTWNKRSTAVTKYTARAKKLWWNYKRWCFQLPLKYDEHGFNAS